MLRNYKHIETVSGKNPLVDFMAFGACYDGN
jgi:hypothetical protein